MVINVVEWTRLEPWRVARARTDRDETVIIKWTGPHASRARDEPWRVRTEAAALRFLSEDLGAALAPRVLAVDLAAGRLVLEDLAPRAALDGLLRRHGAGTHADRLTAAARTRGELGAITAGHAAAYYRRRAALGPVDPAADRLGRVARQRESGMPSVLGVPVSGGVEREFGAALAELAEPGPFLVLSNGDAEANNVLVRAEGPADARLIDFEFAGFTHALHDAVPLHVPGPGWLSVGGPAEGEAYRRALAAGVPQAEDDGRYGRGLAAACVSYALARLTRLAVLDGRPAGDDSRAQLVAILEAAARTAEGALPRLAGWCRQVAAALRRRWPDADVDFGALAPYTSRR
ncbi:hypothetical protein ACNF49_19110 [Actinomadura sp. ATCC 39365]